MRSEAPSLGRAFEEGWKGFSKYPGLAIGIYLLYMVIGFVGGYIPYLNVLLVILVFPPLIGGFILLYLNIVRDSGPEFGDLFAGFKTGMWQYIGAFWLMYLYALICYIPFFVFLGIGALIGEGAMAALGVIGGLISLVAVIVVLIRWVFVFYLIADGLNEGRIMPAYDKSAKMTEGRRLEVFGVMFVLSLFSMVGAIAFGVGVFFTAPVAACCMVAYYRQFREAYLPGAVRPVGSDDVSMETLPEETV